VFHVTGLLRTGGRYLFANGLHAVAVEMALYVVIAVCDKRPIAQEAYSWPSALDNARFRQCPHSAAA
jgi:hypothetical protein